MENNNSNLNEKGIVQSPRKDGFFMRQFKNHTTSFLLVIVIFIIVGWAVIKMYSMQNQSVKERHELTEEHEARIESLTISSMETTARIFSWAVRGEMIRENMDQVNQLFSSLIKEPGIQRIQIIDPVSAEIILSTDKNDEGKIIEDALILQTERTYHIVNEDNIVVFSPIMGLSSKIGVLLIEVSNPQTP
jgi:putative heme degradation protein